MVPYRRKKLYACMRDFCYTVDSHHVSAVERTIVKKHVNHELSAMRCPHALAEVDLFSPGAQEHWYEAYDILHAEALKAFEGGSQAAADFVEAYEQREHEGDWAAGP